MRATLPVALLLSSLLAACASNDPTYGKHIAQSGPLKVHPGLLGQPVPPELQETPLADAPTPAPKQEMQMDADGLRTQRSVYFDLNSADIKADYEPALRAHARYLASHPEARVRVEGNADERGTAAYNKQLGLKRAKNVRTRLISDGASEKQVAVESLGKSKPRRTGHNETSWSENRRADVIYEKE